MAAHLAARRPADFSADSSANTAADTPSGTRTTSQPEATARYRATGTTWPVLAAPGPHAAPPPRALPPRKARHRDECTTLEQLPNIGRAMAADLRLLGIEHPRDLIDRDPLTLFRDLARRSGIRQDPCVLDTLMAAVDFMGGAEALPWWHYTPQRKLRHPVL